MLYKYKYTKIKIMNGKQQKFIEKSQKMHGNKYDYSKVEYVDSKTKVCIVCPIHGEFYQSPSEHVRGKGCPLCANKKRGKEKMTTEKLINKFINIHDSKYSYEKTFYKNANTKICITCPIHGDFSMLPFNHLKGQGCPKCKGKNITQEDLIEKFKKVHGDKYDYSKVCFNKIKEKVCIICPVHGEFWQTPQKHLYGQGCPKCSYEKKFLTKEEFLKKEQEVHGGKYIEQGIEYKSYKSKIKLVCPLHGEFYQNTTNHLQGCGCPKCANNNSKSEQQIVDFLANNSDFVIKTKNKTVIKPFELDIYIPKMKIAIEYNGLRWHSEQFGKDKNYHLNKTELCNKQGIRLIHIFEDEWIYKQDIVKSRLKMILGMNGKRIFARKCKIKEVSFNDSKEFLEKNHIQGSCMSKYRYGLYYNNELLSLMTFGDKRKNLGSNSENKCFELLRFCNKLDIKVIGGASKLLKHFIMNVNPKEIISYCDRRWSNGDLYEKLGFSFDHCSKPNYFYIINGKRENRFKYRKSELIKNGFDKNKSEHEIMLERNIYRIYDCGTKVYKWKREE